MRRNLLKIFCALFFSLALFISFFTIATTSQAAPSTLTQQLTAIPASPFPISCQTAVCGDLGDAPEMGMTAYPATTTTLTVTSNFPTIYYPAYDSGPFHQLAAQGPYLGMAVSQEKNAHQLPDEDNNITNINLSADEANRDNADDGLFLISSLEECTGNSFELTITVPPSYSGSVIANIWADYNRDGDWNDVGLCGGAASSEWVIKNRNLSLVTGTQTVTVAINAFHPEGLELAPFWMRVSLSSEPAPAPGGLADGRGPAVGYLYGETEDYFLQYHDGSCEEVECAGLAGWQGQ